MSVPDFSMSRDGMERLTELMFLSVVKDYLPYIFGKDARILDPSDVGLRELRPDFIVSPEENSYSIVEVKGQTPNTQLRLEVIANQLKEYSNALRELFPKANIQRVLIIIGALSAEHLTYLVDHGVDRIIDTAQLKRIAESAANEIVRTATTKLPPATADSLLRELEELQPGKSDWSKYQKLVGNILEFLFCPPLEKPSSEIPNQTGVNRRDFVIANYATEGFWHFLRTRFAADIIVIDAKNLKGKIKKNAILQLANYLSDHGAGLFGLIVSRETGDRSADITQREPADLIRQKIEDFRLGF